MYVDDTILIDDNEENLLNVIIWKLIGSIHLYICIRK